ncbi:MAG: methyltransferase domain-containing protein [Microthrixaceae bacterium]
MTDGAPGYLHGHHASVLRSHRWRTAENSAAFLLPRLRQGMRLLDVGCGPATITDELDRRLGRGGVSGIDADQGVIAAARAEYPHLDLAVGDVMDLTFDDGTFDVVYAHQVLQHLADPVGALREMYRVLRPSGTVAVRDSIYASKAWAPDDDLLVRWNRLYHDVARHAGGEPDAGRYLLDWVTTAGFVEPVVTSSTWTFADDETRRWWGGLWAERVVDSAFATRAVDAGLSNRVELEAIAGAFRRWADSPTGVFIVVLGEVLALRPS